MFKNIKSLFIVEEEGPKTDSDKKEKPVARSTVEYKRVENAPMMKQSEQGGTGSVDPKFMDILLHSMEKANIEGFDYLEFRKSLKSLSKMPMDERTRYQSAFAMAQTMGVTPQKLIETANHYIRVLQQEENKFESALHKQRDRQIGNKKEDIQQLEKAIQHKAEQIKRLTEEINAHQKKAEAIKQEISDSTIKIETTKNDFIASYNKLVAQIHEDVENMKQFLK